MASTMNGMALHGGVLPVGGTFFVFSDYARPAVRLAALSQAHVVYFFTHDSIGLGEDGPTHQPDRAARLPAGNAGSACGTSGGRERDRRGVEDRRGLRRARPHWC